MPELRKDPLIGRWVIIATERARRPIDFLVSREQPLPAEECPFCAGREDQTPSEILRVPSPDPAEAWSVRVVPSINPVLGIEGTPARRAHGMYDVMDGLGAHEVIIESPAHVANTADLPVEQLHASLHASVQRITDLGRDPRFRYALLFKNYRDVAGAGRVPHVRSQLIATPVTPKRVKEELGGSRRYYEEKERCLVCDVVQQERQAQLRIVHETDHMVALCPFASRFPFELWVVPKRHSCDFGRIQPEELRDLAGMMKHILARLRTVLEDPPYNYLLHTAPFRNDPGKLGHWQTIEHDYHWHVELIPRLTRMAGFEWGSGFYINPTPPEEAAKYLRDAD